MQDETSRPSVAAGIGRGEVVIAGQNRLGVGAGEVEAAVDNGVGLAVDRHPDADSKGGARCCRLGCREIENGVRCPAAGGGQRNAYEAQQEQE